MKRAFFSIFLYAACQRPFVASVLPTTSMVQMPSWRTQTAEHRVSVEVHLSEGRVEKRKLRGVIAVLRPDKLRLRAIGPAGLSLFDLLLVNDEAKILSAIQKDSPSLHEWTQALALDLACAYDLEPRAKERIVRVDKGTVVIEEPGRSVRLSEFYGTPAVWHRADIVTAKYSVVVEVDDVALDTRLDPSLFAD